MTLDPRAISPARTSGHVSRIEDAGTAIPLGALPTPSPPGATWLRRQLRSRVTVEASFDQLDAALRHFRGRVGFLQHVVSLDFFGDVLVVDGRFARVRRTYRAVLDRTAPGRLSWRGSTSSGTLRWHGAADGRSILALRLAWEPDSLLGLAIATVHLDAPMLRGELRRFADYVAHSAPPR